MILVLNKIYILIQMKLVIVFVLFVATLSLHTRHSMDHFLTIPIPHMQASTDKSTLESEFNGMKKLVDSVSNALTTKDAKKYDFLITKTSQIQAGLNKLQSTLQNYNILITSSSKLCPGVTTFNRSQLRRYVSYTEQKQNDFKEYLSTCVDCSFVSDNFTKIQNLTNAYIENLNKTLDGKYCSSDKVKQERARGIVDLNSSYFKPNLNAKNWYYGSTTASDYKIYIFKRSASYNLTNCPLRTPFVKDEEQTCFDCPQGSIFNLGDQKCDTCKPNQILNIKSGKCDQCLGEKKFINGQLVCKLCILSEGELFNDTNGKCYKCKNDSYLDTDKLSCIKIACDPSTPRFNKITHKCQACGVSETIDPQDITKCIKTNFVGLCPPESPKYDEGLKQCAPCPANTKYNKDTNKCEGYVPVTKVSHFMSAGQCPSEYPIKSSQQIANKRYNFTDVYKGSNYYCYQCPKETIYVQTTNTCDKIICGSTQTFNFTSKTCVQTASTCRKNEIYFININRCLPISMTCDDQHYYSAENNTCIAKAVNCNKDQYYDSSEKKCLLKSQACKGTQTYNQQLHQCEKMVLCKDDQFYNQNVKICEKKKLKCNKDSEYFDNYQVICRPYDFITSPYTPNLIYNGFFSNYQNLYKNSKSSNLGLKDCPFKTPYYQKSANKCIKCASDAPYFDLQKEQCIKCAQKLTYDPYKHTCQEASQTNLSSSINRINI